MCQTLRAPSSDVPRLAHEAPEAQEVGDLSGVTAGAIGRQVGGLRAEPLIVVLGDGGKQGGPLEVAPHFPASPGRCRTFHLHACHGTGWRGGRKHCQWAVLMAGPGLRSWVRLSPNGRCWGCRSWRRRGVEFDASVRNTNHRSRPPTGLVLEAHSSAIRRGCFTLRRWAWQLSLDSPDPLLLHREAHMHPGLLAQPVPVVLASL